MDVLVHMARLRKGLGIVKRQELWEELRRVILCRLLFLVIELLKETGLCMDILLEMERVRNCGYWSWKREAAICKKDFFILG
jgi:hypothetical protein